jgi:hypothetical protein
VWGVGALPTSQTPHPIPVVLASVLLVGRDRKPSREKKQAQLRWLQRRIDAI